MSQNDGMTGHLFEEAVLGYCVVSWKGHMHYREAMVAARKSQPEKKSEIAALLEREVARELGSWDVQYFTAVRTPLDRFHGVDAFLEFRGLVVTLDLTKNPDKEDCCKADLLVERKEVLSMSKLRELAGRIAREFRTKERRAYR